jgi:hypothetical protein
MNKIRFSLAATILTSLVIGLSACAPAVVEEPDHKAKTTACLIRSSSVVPGTPENQLAADLVEAKIVYGLAAREVKIDDNTEAVPTRLLQALQAGCVLMVSANPSYLLDLAEFAVAHPRMIVLFVGGNIAASDQPANFRWVADDAIGSARLAGFFAAGKSTSGEVHLFVQPGYAQASSIRTSFIQGVKDFDQTSRTTTKTVFVRTPTSKVLTAELQNLDSTNVAVIFGGKSIWQSLDADLVDGPYLVGADLQLGDMPLEFESRVQASVERNTSKYVFNAVASLLDRQFAADPLYRKPGALKFKTVELRLTQPESLDGDLLEALAAYEQELIAK